MKRVIPILFLFIWGCSISDSPSKEKIANLYVDILVVEETYKTDVDSMNILIDSLYNYYKIDKAQYLQALESFKYDEETWNEFFAYAEEYLDTLKTREGKGNFK